MKNIFVIVPVYNESKVVIKVIKELQKKFKNIVCVDDCSTDDSFFKLKKLKRITLIKHIINQGQGAALQTGINFAKLNKADLFVTFDSDGQHSATEAAAMIKKINSMNVDIILGSRFKKKSLQLEIPVFRRIILKIAIIISNLFSGLRLTDTHNGLRVFNRRFSNTLNIKMNGMSHPNEFLDNIKKNNLKYLEYPTKIKYNNYTINKGQKNINSLNILFDIIINKIKK